MLKSESLREEITENKELLEAINERLKALKKAEQRLEELEDRQEQHQQPVPKVQLQRTKELSTEPVVANQNAESDRRVKPIKQYSTGVPELETPGMRHRLTSQGPAGHAVYVLESVQHGAWKVGKSKTETLGTRIQDIRKSVPDARLVGLSVFTSAERASKREEKIHKKLKDYRYRNISGERAGRTEWFTQKPSGFPSPERIEEMYREDQEQSHQVIESDENTIYLMYSESRDKYLIKWCATKNLKEKLRDRKTEVPDAELIARFPIANQDKCWRICNDFNRDCSTTRGRITTVHWHDHSEETLAAFRNWTPEGTKKENAPAA